MKRNNFTLAVLFTIALSAFTLCGCSFGFYPACVGEDGPDQRFSGGLLKGEDNPFSSGAAPSKYSGVVFTDPHFGSQKGNDNSTRFLKFLDEAFNDPDETKRPRFLVCLGDIANGGKADEYVLYNEFVGKVKELAKNSLLADDNFKVYGLLGNHDLYNYGWDNWQPAVYPYMPNYYFSIGNVRFYFLDTANSALGNKQYEWLYKAMNAVPFDSLVFTHYPLYDNTVQIFKMQDSFERNNLIKLYSDRRVKHVFVGHAHKNQIYDFGKFQEQLLGSMRYTGTVSYFTVDTAAGTNVEQKVINLYDYE